MEPPSHEASTLARSSSTGREKGLFREGSFVFFFSILWYFLYNHVIYELFLYIHKYIYLCVYIHICRQSLYILFPFLIFFFN